MDKKDVDQIEITKTHSIRVGMSSLDHKAITAVMAKILENAKVNSVSVKSHGRNKVVHLEVPVRRAPNGEGTNTWDHFKMRIHSAKIDFITTAESVKQVTNFAFPPSVFVEVTILQQ